MNNHSDLESSKKNSTYSINKRLFWCFCFFVALLITSFLFMSVIFYLSRPWKPEGFYLLDTVSTESDMQEQVMLFVNFVRVRVEATEWWYETSENSEGLMYAFYVSNTSKNTANCLLIAYNILKTRE